MLEIAEGWERTVSCHASRAFKSKCKGPAVQALLCSRGQSQLVKTLSSLALKQQKKRIRLTCAIKSFIPLEVKDSSFAVVTNHQARRGGVARIRRGQCTYCSW